MNLDTLPKISKESIINIDSLINASRLQTRDSPNRAKGDLHHQRKTVTDAGEYT